PELKPLPILTYRTLVSCRLKVKMKEVGVPVYGSMDVFLQGSVCMLVFHVRVVPVPLGDNGMPAPETIHQFAILCLVQSIDESRPDKRKSVCCGNIERLGVKHLVQRWIFLAIPVSGGH